MIETFNEGESIVLSIPISGSLSDDTDFTNLAITADFYGDDEQPVMGDVELTVLSKGELEYAESIRAMISKDDLDNIQAETDSQFFQVIVKIDANGKRLFNWQTEFLLKDLVTRLRPYKDSFTSYGHLIELADSCSEAGVFLQAESECRRVSLVQAFRDLKDLPLVVKRSIDSSPREILVFEAMKYPDFDFTEEELEDFALAQLKQAIFNLGGYPSEDYRKQGVIQQTGGSSMTMWRNSKILPTVVSNAAIKVLKPYIKYKVRVGRSA